MDFSFFRGCLKNESANMVHVTSAMKVLFCHTTTLYMLKPSHTIYVVEAYQLVKCSIQQNKNKILTECIARVDCPMPLRVQSLNLLLRPCIDRSIV